MFILGACLVAAGIAGCLLPVVPGAPLVFLGLVVAAWAEGFEFVGIATLAVLAALALLTYIVDIVAGVLGARRFGASPRALYGAGIGAFVGLFFGLAGVLVGPFAGAVAGQLTAEGGLAAAGRAGVGATVGLIIGAAGKIALVFTMLGIFAVARLAG